jgi:hypothetical protein
MVETHPLCPPLLKEERGKWYNHEIMKKFIPFLMVLIFLLLILTGTRSQSRPPVIPKEKRDFRVLNSARATDDVPIISGSKFVNPVVSPNSALSDPSTMVTTYDLQTNGSTSPRIYRYPDGTVGAVCTWSSSISGSQFPDRGTGYNYFNGTVWGPQPTARIETSVRTGWPSYAPYGSNGEIVIAHNITAGATLVLSTRNSKGLGTWNVTQPTGIGPPTGAPAMGWPRMVTNGSPRNNIHILALTEPVSNGGTIYQGLDGALLYNRSTDGGITWTGWQLLPGMTSTEYQGFGGDTYAWAEPRGDTLCFTVGDMWMDQYIMKSLDNGSTWMKTKVWTCLYDLWPGTYNTDTFYCSDAYSAVALDKNGKAHVAFGLQRAVGDSFGGRYFFPWTDGLVYWNENMPELPQSLDPDTLLNHGNLVGWVQDPGVFGMSSTQLAYYYCSLSSMPVIVSDKYNYVFVVWAGMTTLLDQNANMYRHLFARASQDGGWTWCDTIIDITSGFQYDYTECVYPSIAPVSTDSLFLLFQGDPEAGCYLKSNAQGQYDITHNDMFFNKPSKQSILKCINVGIDEKKDEPSFKVYQNNPNPFIDKAQVRVMLNKPGRLSMTVSSIMGQKIMEIDKGTVAAGDYQFTLTEDLFKQGIYLYTIKFNSESITKKLIVE